MNKKQFFRRLRKIRAKNKRSTFGKVKKKYSALDNELSWRIFQLFPTEWSDEDRFRGMVVLTSHITILSIFYINLGMPKKEIVDRIYEFLRIDLDYYLGKKYIELYVSQVLELQKLNS